MFVILCSSKAVANGAVAWFLDGLVHSRIAKVDYGIQCSMPFRPQEPAHQARKARVYKSSDGRQKLPGHFSTILAMGASGATDQEYIEDYSMTFADHEPLDRTIKLFICRREAETPLPLFTDEPGL